MHARDGGTRGGWLAGIAVVGITLVLGAPATSRWFDNPDDWDHLDTAQALLSGQDGAWRDLFLGDVGIASVRPLPTMLWAADRAVWGLSAGGYFATNLLLVALLAALGTAFVWRVTRSTAVAAAAGALIGLSVSANQPMYYLASRDDALANVLIVGALLAWLASREAPAGRWVAAGLAFLSALCKPTVVLLPLALLALDRFPSTGRPVRSPAMWLRRQAPVLAALAVYLALMSFALGFAFSGLLPPRDGEAGNTLMNVLGNVFLPHILPSYLMHERIPSLWADVPRLLLLGGAVWSGVRDGWNRTLLMAGAAVWVVGVLPTLPFLAQEQFCVQDAGRYLQLPAVGFALICCGGLDGLSTRRRVRLGWMLVAASVLAFMMSARPMLGGGFSPSQALYGALVEQSDAMPADGRLFVGVSRLDAGASSLLVSDVLKQRVEERQTLLFLQGGSDVFESERGVGERFAYSAFKRVGALSLDALSPSDRVLFDGEDEDRLPWFGVSATLPTTTGAGRRWDLELKLNTRTRLPAHAVWRSLRLAPRIPVVMAVPGPMKLDPSSVCSVQIDLAVDPAGPRDQRGGRGPMEALVPTGRFALLLFSDKASPTDPLEHWLVLPMADESGPQTVEADLRNAPGWAGMGVVRWMGLVPSDRPSQSRVTRVELVGCP